jgi:hypothetical protein
MKTTKKKKTAPKKRKGKRNKKKTSALTFFRQWSLPFCIFLLVSISLAAAFYIIFLHTPTKPLF